jgi:hypothetical protein
MSEDFQRYPYSGEYITLKDAVAFICVVVYPDEGQDEHEKAKEKKRVRRRICQAGEDGLLHILERERDKAILATELFTWAVERKGWARLYLVPGLPVRPASGSLHSSAPGFSVVGIGVSIPVDRPELERQFTDTHVQLFQARREIERLRLENATLRADVENLRAKKADISKKRRESAEKPRPK